MWHSHQKARAWAIEAKPTTQGTPLKDPKRGGVRHMYVCIDIYIYIYLFVYLFIYTCIDVFLFIAIFCYLYYTHAGTGHQPNPDHFFGQL